MCEVPGPLLVDGREVGLGNFLLLEVTILPTKRCLFH